MKRKAKTSKFIRLYGMTLKEIAEQARISVYKAYLIHLENKIIEPPTQECKCGLGNIKKK